MTCATLALSPARAVSGCRRARTSRGFATSPAATRRQGVPWDVRTAGRPAQRASFAGGAVFIPTNTGFALAASVHDVPPDGITRLHSPEEYEAMVAATGSGSLPAIVMNKSKSCKPCRAFNKTYYQYAEKFKGRCDFYEIYGDESKETIKLMMKMKVKSTPNFRIYKGGRKSTSTAA